jgi:hypothetical protein
MAIAQEWQKSLDGLRDKFDALAGTDAGFDIPASLREELQQIKTAGWNSERQVFVFGQLDVEKMIAVAREGLVEWWPAFNGRAYFGDIDAVRKIRAAFEENPGKSEKPKLDSSMTWVAHPYALKDGALREPDARILEQMFRWGADPMTDKGKYYDKALRLAPPDIIRVFVSHNAPLANANAAFEELMKARNYAQALNIQKAYGFDGFYTMVDGDTLLETKYAREAAGRDSVFKTLFNFRARRVTEVYETGAGNDARATMTVSDFGQYDTQALRRAQEVLEKMGGRPPDTLDKPRPRLGGTKP